VKSSKFRDVRIYEKAGVDLPVQGFVEAPASEDPGDSLGGNPLWGIRDARQFTWGLPGLD
jgi:hypothetical protein